MKWTNLYNSPSKVFTIHPKYKKGYKWCKSKKSLEELEYYYHSPPGGWIPNYLKLLGLTTMKPKHDIEIDICAK